MSSRFGQKVPRPAPFSLRLTFGERAKLETNAGSMPLSAYIKSVLFAQDAAKYRKRRANAHADVKLLAEVLSCLGASRIADNVSQLAKAADSGTLYLDDDTKLSIKRAFDDVRVMRVLLMQSLGMKVDQKALKQESVSQTFARAATKPKGFKP